MGHALKVKCPLSNGGKVEVLVFFPRRMLKYELSQATYDVL